MSNVAKISHPIENVIARGDLTPLTPDQRMIYYRQVCETLGLNPLTQPFAYITLNSKLCLYARKDATDQLRKIHKISVSIIKREQIGDVYVVTARAQTPEGRHDESTGAVAIGNSKGDALANSLMKAETKSKRRVTLSICGLGFLDETETETIPAERSAMPPPPAIEHKPSPNNGTELYNSIGNTERYCVQKSLCQPDEIFARMEAWAREEMGCELPIREWPANVVDAACREMKIIRIQMKGRERKINEDEEKEIVEMLTRKGRKWGDVILAQNLPGKASPKDLNFAQWQAVMGKLSQEYDAKPAAR